MISLLFRVLLPNTGTRRSRSYAFDLRICSPVGLSKHLRAASMILEVFLLVVLSSQLENEATDGVDKRADEGSFYSRANCNRSD